MKKKKQIEKILGFLKIFVMTVAFTKECYVHMK